MTMIQNIKSFLSLSPEDLKQSVILKQKEDVFYLVLNTKANTFTKTFIRNIQLKLDQVEAHNGPTALVTLSLSKLFSGGLDLKYTSNLEPEDRKYFILEFIGLVGRISVLPFPTICLVRGAAVAGGCMLSFAHDFIYVAGTAFFTTNESQLGLYFPPGMMAVVKKKHVLHTSLRDMVVLSKPIPAERALQEKIIDGIWKEQQALQKVQASAQQIASFGQNKSNMKSIKSELHKDMIQACFNKQMAPGSVGQAKTLHFPKL